MKFSKFLIYGGLYYLAGLSLSLLVENLVFTDVGKHNSHDLVILFSVVARILCLIIGIWFIKKILKNEYASALLIVGCITQLSFLIPNTKHILDTYITAK